MTQHASDCATNNGPALPAGACDCDGVEYSKTLVTIQYTNHRGVYGERQIAPGRIYFGSTEWHPEPQWLLVALDVEKQAERHFALKDIVSWR